MAMVTQSKIISTISKEGSCSLCHHNLTQSVPPEYSFSYIWDHSTQVHTMIVRTQFIPNMVTTKDWPTLHKNRFPPQQDYCPTRSRFCPEHRHYPQKTAVQRDTNTEGASTSTEIRPAWDSSAPSSPSHWQDLALTKKHSARYSNQLCINS